MNRAQIAALVIKMPWKQQIDLVQTLIETIECETDWICEITHDGKVRLIPKIDRNYEY